MSLVKYEEPSSLTDTMTLGDIFRQSGYFNDIRDKAQAVVKILCGRELGLTPVVSMMGIHIIQGKPTLSSNLMAALIKRSGKYDYRVKHRFNHPSGEPCPDNCLMWNNTECVLLFRENTDQGWVNVGDASFSMDDAKRAQIKLDGASSWNKFPKAMLFARALSQGLRAYCPDVSSSPIYNPEELGAEVNEEGDVINVEVKPVEPAGPKKPISFKKSDTTDFSRPATFYDESKKESVAPNGGTAGSHQPTIKDTTPVSVQKGSEPPAAATDLEAQLKASVEAQYISVANQKEFHAECRKAAKDRNKADEHTYQWLIDNGYVKENGEPSASKIPAKYWPKAMQMAAKWISVQ